jgi:hypothetical protein
MSLRSRPRPHAAALPAGAQLTARIAGRSVESSERLGRYSWVADLSLAWPGRQGAHKYRADLYRGPDATLIRPDDRREATV